MYQPYMTDPDPITTESPIGDPTPSEPMSAVEELLTESDVPSHSSSGADEPLIREKAPFSRRNSMALTGMTMMLGMLLVTQVSAGTKDWIKSQSSISNTTSVVTPSPVPTPSPTPQATVKPSPLPTPISHKSFKAQ